MQGQFFKLLERVDGLTMRERYVVLAAGIAVVLLFWYMLFGEQALENYERMGTELADAKLQLADVQARIDQQTQQTSKVVDPHAKLQQLQHRTETVDDLIRGYAAELISPTEMARLLERVLERREVLSLRRLRNLGAKDLLPDDSPGQHRLYRHGLEMELEGPYLAVLAYLEDLEALPWRLYWQVLEIDADEYPKNRVRIEVATLSLHEEWIGV